METFQKRLIQAMEIRGMRQVDLAEKSGLPKAQISQYKSGKYEPLVTFLTCGSSLFRACSATSKLLKGKHSGRKNDIIGASKIQWEVRKSLHLRGRSRCIRTAGSFELRIMYFRMENWTLKMIGSNWQHWFHGTSRSSGMRRSL